MKPPRIVLLVALTAALASSLPAQASRPWYASELEALGFEVFSSPRPVPAFQVEALGRENARLADLKGKVVLLNLWATWCPPCRAEMPSIQGLWAKLKDKSFTVMAVSVGEDRQKVRDFIDKTRYAFPVYLDPKGAVGQLFGASSIPTTYIIDKSGRAIAYAVGSREYGSAKAMAVFEELATR